MDVRGHSVRIEELGSTPFVDALRTTAGQSQTTHVVEACAAIGPGYFEGARVALTDLGGEGLFVLSGIRHCKSVAAFSVAMLVSCAMSPDGFGTIAILGGTGDQGLGLALRLAAAGCHVVIGSREKARAESAAAEVAKAIPDARVEGRGNSEATAGAQIVVLSVPFEHTVSTLASVRDALEPGQIVVSMVVPLATAIGDRPTRTVRVQQGSAAELVASLVPDGVEVVGALQNVSAHRLQDLEVRMDCDVVVCGAREARARIAQLCELIPGLRGVNGGVLSNARIVEDMTALIIGLNIRYKVPGGIGVRFPGIPQ